MKPTFSPSPQQSAVFDWVENGSGSAVIEAVAGSGKTTTLVESLKLTRGDVAFCAFNKPVADEIGGRVQPLGLSNRVKTGTVHSFGNGILRATFPKTRLDTKKLSLIADQVTKKHYLKTFATNAASMAKQVGIGVICPISDTRSWVKMIDHHSLQDSLPKYADFDEAVKLAQKVLQVSNNNCAKMIDFDDMVYIPVLMKLRAKQFDWVFLDEAQDTNVVRRKLVELILSPSGRLVAVGDGRQAIYGFTGADHQALENICTEFNAIRLPLTTTYRCPKEVVKVANRWVSHIEAADTAPDGTVDSSDLGTLVKESSFSPEDAVLCRVTKPLVSLAFHLIGNGIPCKVEGRSIGKGLLKIIKKWKVYTVGEIYAQVDKWHSAELASALEHDSGSRCEYIEDQAATLKILADQCNREDDIQVIVDLIEKLFGDTDSGKGGKPNVLTLSTIHKSKGREWDRVFILGMSAYSPCKWARQPWEMIQEDNLCYVQVTRAKKHLTFIGEGL